ncbi:family 1 glycosylhydrolase [Novosphingobium sp. PASSN1]|uniref:glycoside hydrolase family 1 protein n=1 Tax=Novosphingobium sp. PASSN1 TaxID=2015561 RepID=UPI000BDC3D07|nr:family 1 glycosylhydrolase [Novosphingobium sp. PASSN1]OYU35401.1 MAG: beta-glucosidase [Novosphingobium sp. PASSN1]
MAIDRRTFVAATAAGLALGAAPRAAAKAVKAAAAPQPFPSNFIWGAATAGHQVEGNNVNADCWLLENIKPSAFVERSGDAANSFELWRTDLDLAKNLGLNAYRFSLEWARIEPEPGQFSIAMLDHYKAMIEGARAVGLKPIVTFNHFTTPIWFAARGGWMNDEAPQLFARFCDKAARHLAAGIDHATTLNEPNLAGVLQYILPPFLLDQDKAMVEAAAKKLGVPLFLAGNALYQPDRAKVQANLQAGHTQGKAAIKAVRGDLPVGVSLAMIDDQEATRGSVRDAMREKFYNSWLRLAQADDFLGVQNYERALWGKTGKLPAPADGRRNYIGAEVYPASLAGAVRYAHEVSKVPIMVTEHGVGTEDDTTRAWFIPEALDHLRAAIADGVPVKGYLHWSLIDNFEWVFGYKPKFGLHSFDRETFARTPKPSALVYRDYIKSHTAGA